MEKLRKAAMLSGWIALCCRSCHGGLEGIYVNCEEKLSHKQVCWEVGWRIANILIIEPLE